MGSRKGSAKSTRTTRSASATSPNRRGSSVARSSNTKKGGQKSGRETTGGAKGRKRQKVLQDSSNVREEVDEEVVSVKKRRNLHPPTADDESQSSESSSEESVSGAEGGDDEEGEEGSGDDDEENEGKEGGSGHRGARATYRGEVGPGNKRDENGKAGGVELEEVTINEGSDNASALSSQPSSQRSYSESFARNLLRSNGVMHERDMLKFVVHEVFGDMKFTDGDEEVEMGLCQMAIDEGYVTIGDPMIANSAFVSQYFPKIATNCTLLRQRARDSSTNKFKNALKLDIQETNKPNVLPPNLGDVLTSPSYRKYHYRGGALIEERRADYEVFKWFVKNILYSVNYELNSVRLEQAMQMGHNDFISKVFTVSDEAFAILLVLNYEDRWRNLVLTPAKDKKDLYSNPMYACKWTSSKKGYTRLPWDSEGIEKYNELLANVEKLRAQPQFGEDLEARVKQDFENEKTGPKKRKKKNRVVETRPVMGGALQQKLAAMKNK